MDKDCILYWSISLVGHNTLLSSYFLLIYKYLTNMVVVSTIAIYKFIRQLRTTSFLHYYSHGIILKIQFVSY